MRKNEYIKDPTKNGYFDIELDIEKIAKEDLNNAFLLQDLKQRKLFLETDIEGFYSVSDIVKNIMQYNSDDEKNGIPVEERKPILLYIASPGGSVDDGFSLVNAIEMSKTPVHTINMGKAYSMGFLIFISGHKRYSYPDARFLLHDGSNFVYDSTSKVKDRMEFEDQVEQRLTNYVIRHSKITKGIYDENYRREWWMFPEEAKECGFVDYIIGKDCGIEEVI